MLRLWLPCDTGYAVSDTGAAYALSNASEPGADARLQKVAVVVKSVYALVAGVTVPTHAHTSQLSRNACHSEARST